MSEQTETITQTADREKKMVALSSVVAAIFLTSVKIVVALLTGSLGILSEAAHSGLDLVAAGVTFFAVRLSGQPPDPEHTYGHGKIENLSALFETFLLLLTCVWIIYEAIQRLFFKSFEVETSIWAFLIMAVSIVIDFTRSRALSRVAKKYDSQALEADALHFSTDIWSSFVVIAGLIFVALSEWLNIPWLSHADAVAAMGVAVIVIYVSVQLGQKTISDLLDAIPPGLRQEIVRDVKQVPGVIEVKQARVRRSGPEFFADLEITIARGAGLEQAQRIANQAEGAVLNNIPGADVMVKAVPVATDHEGMLTKIRLLASHHNLGVHSIRGYDVMGEHSLEMHVEVSESLQLAQAYDQVKDFEQELRQILPEFDRIITHMEPIGESAPTREAIFVDERSIRRALSEFSEETGTSCDFHDILVRCVTDEITVAFGCTLSQETPVTDAHDLTERIEQFLRARVPNLGRVIIHVEPELTNPS
jgi:cation diffusion facilitator family transporter